MHYNKLMKKYQNILRISLSILGIICLIGAAYLFVSNQRDKQHAENTFDELRPSNDNFIPNTPPAALTEEPVTASPTPDTEAAEEPLTAEPTVLPSVTPEPIIEENPYRDSFLANDDMVAWLKIPDTGIDYPVMWTPGDEEYYLYRDFNGKDNKNGCLLLDTDSSVSPFTTNLIIHGHNMKSGAMFGNLTDYEKESYYDSHKEIFLYTRDCMKTYEVIAVFRSQVFKKSDTVFKFYKFFQADTQEEFDDFYNNIKKMSLYDTGVTAEFGDRFITLSTCVYHVKNGRFVVVAREKDTAEQYLPIEE